jgi:hypothetical protein
MDLIVCPTRLSIIVIWFGKTYIHVTWFWFHVHLPTTHSCNSFRPVSVPAVAVQTIRPCLEQNNAVTTGSDKIDLPVLSKCKAIT